MTVISFPRCTHSHRATERPAVLKGKDKRLGSADTGLHHRCSAHTQGLHGPFCPGHPVQPDPAHRLQAAA